MVMLRSDYGFAATTSSTKRGKDTLNPSSVESDRDSLCHSADGSQGSEYDTSSEDQRPNEDGGSTLTEESSDHHLDFPFEFPEDFSKAETNRALEQLRTEIRMASLPIRNEAFRLRTNLRCHINDSRTKLNKLRKFSRYQECVLQKPR